MEEEEVQSPEETMEEELPEGHLRPQPRSGSRNSKSEARNSKQALNQKFK
jgi:hypothetical protein